MASFNYNHFRCSFQDWMTQQHKDLEELVRLDSAATDEDLKQLIEKGIKHFENYCGRRASMVRHDAPCFMTPPRCCTFENAFMWIGGCRPSHSIRLIYYVCGSELDEQLDGFLRGERKGNLAELSGEQLVMINALHCKIVKEEDTFSTRIAALQACAGGDSRFATGNDSEERGRSGEWSREVESAMAAHSESMVEVVAEADRLRMETLKEVMGILTPLQGVDLLIATKKLHISMHCWGMRREGLSDQQTSP